MKKYFSLAIVLFSFVFSTSAIKVTRSVFPKEIKSGGEAVISLNIVKEGAEGFAKLMDSIPAGFKVEELNSSNGNFIVENGKLRIIWLAMPGGDSFKAEYKLIHDGKKSGLFKIEGNFYFVKDDKRAELKLASTSLNVEAAPEQEELAEVTPIAEVVKVALPVVDTDTVKAEVEEVTAKVVEKAEEVAPIVEKVEEGALVFKVQLGAYSTEKPKSMFGDLPDIHFVKAGAVYKYYSGNFKSEAEARNVIPQAKAQGFKGAFLVRFKDGKRI